MRPGGAVLRYWLPAALLAAGCASTAPEALTDQMRLKGYTESTEKADLRIVYETTTAQRVENNPVQVGVGVGSWGSNVGGSVSVGSQNVRSYSEGALVVHVIDDARNAEVWEGRISTRIDKGVPDPSTVASTVAKVMRDFPARPS